MNRFILLVTALFALSACADEAVKGTEAADNCVEVTCPVGTAPTLESEAESACGGSASVDRGLTDLGVSASAQCFGSGSCSLICDPPEPCCGGEAWTETSYTCETPCAATCSCDGKCGVVTGADCEADCGACGSGQLCSENLCVGACPEGSEPCGDACAFAADGEVCHLGEICNPAEFCVGRECNAEDWVDNPCQDCEALGAPGCGPAEVCGGGECVSGGSCEGSNPVCGAGDEAAVVKECEDDDGDGTWAWNEQANCSLSDETPYCANLVTGAACVECTEKSHCKGEPGDTMICQDNACAVECTPDCTDKDCGSDGCGGSCGLAETTNGCAEDAPYCQVGACETWEEACPVAEGENFCNGDKGDGEVYLGTKGPHWTMICEANDLDEVSLTEVDDCAKNTLLPLCSAGTCVECVKDANCDSDEVCLGETCVTKKPCPVTEGEAVCNGEYDKDQLATAVLTCAYDAEGNAPDWSFVEDCEATGLLCWDGACQDSLACPSENQYCNTSPETGAKWDPSSDAEVIMTCETIAGGTGIYQDPGTDCDAPGIGKVCIEVAGVAECQVPAACPSGVSFCNGYTEDGVDDDWNEAFSSETVLKCSVDEVSNTLVFETTGDAECGQGYVCVNKGGGDTVKTAVCEEEVAPCEAPTLCNKKPDGDPYKEGSLANHNVVVGCAVNSVTNEQDYWKIGDCWDDTPGGEVCKEGKCVTKNACPDDAPADAAVCNQAGWMGKNDNSYGADSVVTCKWDEFTNTYTWDGGDDCAEDGQICWQGTCSDNQSCPSENQYCNTDPVTQTKWDTQADPEQIMTCSTEQGGTVIVQEPSGTNCAPDVCVQSIDDTGAECEVKTALEADKCAPVGEAVMTSSVDAWNDLVWETTDCPAGAVCVPSKAACELPVQCPIAPGVPICDDGSYPDELDQPTEHDLVTCTVDSDSNTVNWVKEACDEEQLCFDDACDDEGPTILSFTVDEVEAGSGIQVMNYVQEIALFVDAEDAAGKVTYVILKDGEPWKVKASTNSPMSEWFFPMACDGCNVVFQVRATDESGNETLSEQGALNLSNLAAGDTIWETDYVDAADHVVPKKVVEFSEGQWGVLGNVSGLSAGCPWVNFFENAEPADFTATPVSTGGPSLCTDFTRVTDISFLDKGKGIWAATVAGNPAPTYEHTSWGVMKRHPVAGGWTYLGGNELTDSAPGGPHADGPSEFALTPSLAATHVTTRLVTAGKIDGTAKNDDHMIIVDDVGFQESQGSWGTTAYSESAGVYMMFPAQSAITQAPTELLYIAGRKEKESDGTNEPFLSKFVIDSKTGTITQAWQVPGAGDQSGIYFTGVSPVGLDGAVLVSGVDTDAGWKSFVSKYNAGGVLMWTMYLDDAVESAIPLLTGITASVWIKEGILPFIDDGRFILSGATDTLRGWVALFIDKGDSAELVWEWEVDGCDLGSGNIHTSLGRHGYIDVAHSCKDDPAGKTFTRFRRLSP